MNVLRKKRERDENKKTQRHYHYANNKMNDILKKSLSTVNPLDKSSTALDRYIQQGTSWISQMSPIVLWWCYLIDFRYGSYFKDEKFK